jgi:hypothetical protein
MILPAIGAQFFEIYWNVCVISAVFSAEQMKLTTSYSIRILC